MVGAATRGPGALALLCVSLCILLCVPLPGCSLCWPRGGTLGRCAEGDDDTGDDDTGDDDTGDDDTGDDDTGDDDTSPDPCVGPFPSATLDPLGYELICVPPDTFWMGSSDPEAREDETLHRVQLTRGFLLGRTEVTQPVWREVWGGAVSDCLYGCSDTHPAQSMSWLQAVEWLNLLSDADGLTPVYTLGPDGLTATADWDADGWRLPTEAEWEFAARAGEDAPYSGSADASEVAWCGGAAEPPYEARPVGLKVANAWGFVDMSGNVAEWVWDGQSDYPQSGTTSDPVGPDGGPGLFRIFRGGHFASSSPVQCRVSRREATFSSTTNWNRGFRIARTVP